MAETKSRSPTVVLYAALAAGVKAVNDPKNKFPMRAMEDAENVALCGVIGIGNLDSTPYSEGYAVRGEDGLYRRIEDGAVIGDFAALIDDTCENGEVQEWLDELREQLTPEQPE